MSMSAETSSEELTMWKILQKCVFFANKSGQCRTSWNRKKLQIIGGFSRWKSKWQSSEDVLPLAGAFSMGALLYSALLGFTWWII